MARNKYQYYPTPENMVKLMIDKLSFNSLENKVILEPSAGRGHIVTFMRKHMPDPENTGRFFCIEIDEENMDFLSQVVGYENCRNSNFLSYSKGTYERFDAVIMNPPFISGAQHLLRAIDSIYDYDKTEIVCLLNAKTIREPKTPQEKMLAIKIEDLKGQVSFHAGEFIDSDVSTGVEVALVYIPKNSKPGEKLLDIDFDKTPEFGEFFELPERDPNAIASEMSLPSNIIMSLAELISYMRRNKDIILTMLQRFETLKHYLQLRESDSGKSSKKNEENFDRLMTRYMMDPEKDLRDLIILSRNMAWKKYLYSPELKEVHTTSLTKEFDMIVEHSANYPFTPKNVDLAGKAIMSIIPDVTKRMICDSFDWLTQYSADNRVHTEGWITNNAFQIGKRVILPYIKLEHFYGDRYNLKYNNGTDFNNFHDLERTLYMIETDCTAKEALKHTLSFDESSSIDKRSVVSLQRMHDIIPGHLYETKYFTVRCYKKGTIHVTFKDPVLIERLNLMAAMMKKWLTPGGGEALKKNVKNSKKKAPEWINAYLVEMDERFMLEGTQKTHNGRVVDSWCIEMKRNGITELVEQCTYAIDSENREEWERHGAYEYSDILSRESKEEMEEIAIRFKKSMDNSRFDNITDIKVVPCPSYEEYKAARKSGMYGFIDKNRRY